MANFKDYLIDILKAPFGVWGTSRIDPVILDALTNKLLNTLFEKQLIIDVEKTDSESEDLKAALENIESASKYLARVQSGLKTKDEQLKSMLADIDANKTRLEKYRRLADLSEDGFAAVKDEIRTAVRTEFEAAAAKGKTKRIIISCVGSAFTLVLGAALGAYFKDIMGWCGISTGAN